jgi:hypothetical protein
LFSVYARVGHKKQLSLFSAGLGHVTSHDFEVQSGENLSTCNFHGILAKYMNFEPNVGNYTAANENLNVQ